MKDHIFSFSKIGSFLLPESWKVKEVSPEYRILLASTLVNWKIDHACSRSSRLRCHPTLCGLYPRKASYAAEQPNEALGSVASEEFIVATGYTESVKLVIVLTRRVNFSQPL